MPWGVLPFVEKETHAQAVFVPYNLRVQGGASAEQPVLQALGALRDHTRLSPRWFSRILDARVSLLLSTLQYRLSRLYCT